jgi:type II secretory pathway pseudopilin PulG
MRKKIAPKPEQLGQTLIETLVAIFILTTGLITAITLGIYSFNSTDNSSKQIVATALARQGVEAVKNIRDSNWLSDPLVDCSGTMGANQSCHPNWQGGGANRLSTGDYAVDFNFLGGTDGWTMSRSPANFSLNYDPSTGQYHNGGSGAPSIYSRDVNIAEDSSAPYTVANPKLVVTSTVWWSGRACPVTASPDTLPASCKTSLQMYLTNWKNY